MNAKQLVGMLIEAIIKIVIFVIIIMFVYKGALAAYDFGYRVFAEEPISASGGRTITISIADDATVEGIGEMLEQKGLIRDAKLFVVQEFFSAYHDEIKPGIYDLSTAMTTEELLEVMSTQKEEVIETQSVAEEEEDTLQDEGQEDALPEDTPEGDVSE